MNKIGYPDKWRDYSNLKIVRGDALGNRCECMSLIEVRDLAQDWQAGDKNEWQMTPPTVMLLRPQITT